MAIFPDHMIPGFLLEPKYRFIRYLLSVLVLGVITVNMVIDNIHNLGNTLHVLLEWIIYFLVTFGVIPVNVFILLPRYLLKNRPVAYFFWIVLLILLSLALLGYMQIYVFSDKNIVDNIGFAGMLLNFISSFISMGFLIVGSSSIVLIRHWIRAHKRINELESATLRSEIELLKSQINPHFLFNMLNNANVLIWKNKKEAQYVLYKLEDLLRYQLNEINKDKVLLSFDIRFIDDFLNLEKIRRDKFEYSILKEGNMEGVWLPPLLFIPFVENAIKHNHDATFLSYVHLGFIINPGCLEFYCENSKPINKPFKNRPGGLGLKNIQRRLALLYPERYKLDIYNEDTKYIVKLKLIL